MRTWKYAFLLFLIASIAAIAMPISSQCIAFNNIALQLAIAPNQTQSPITLQQIQSMLGTGQINNNASTRTYSWIHKNRALIIKTKDGRIIEKILSGIEDGSQEEKNMQLAYDSLASASSDLIIKSIQNQLGAGSYTSVKLQKYSWQCGIGSLILTVDQNNNPTNADISYSSMQGQDAIELQVGPEHPKWDSILDYLGSSTCTWSRTFETGST